MGKAADPHWQKGAWRVEFRRRQGAIEAALREAPSVSAAWRALAPPMSERQFRRYVALFLRGASPAPLPPAPQPSPQPEKPHHVRPASRASVFRHTPVVAPERADDLLGPGFSSGARGARR